MKYCVMVLAVGSPMYKQDALNVLTHYFNKHEIPFHVIETAPGDIDFRGSHPSWWKLLAHKILVDYDFIICWDLDLLPRNMDVKVIEEFNMTKMCMAWDSHAKFKSHDRFTPNFKYNGGLIGIPKEHRLFTEGVFNKYAPGTYPSYEQYYLNDEIHFQNIQIHELPWDINVLYSFSDFNNARLQHYTYTHTAKSFIKDHKNKYFNNLVRPSFDYRKLLGNFNSE